MAIPMFSGSNFLMVPLPVSRDVDIRQKSKMAVRQNEMYIFDGCMADERQFLILSDRICVHELKEYKNDNICNMPTPDS